MMEFAEDERLIQIAEKLEKGARLSSEDGLAILKSTDILTIGELATRVKLKKNGSYVYFIVNLHINPTNICTGTCRFCAFRKKKGEKGAFELTTDQIIKKISKLIPKGITEVHIVGGLHPDWKYERYIEIIKSIRKNFPGISIQAYTAEEIDHMSKISGKSAEAVIGDLIEAGINSIAGGSAEIFDERLRKRLCPNKIPAHRYLEIHRISHRMGIKTNASILYGHIETYRHRVNHLLKLRELQDETGGFQAFIPFAYHPENTNLGGEFTTGFEDLKMLATARLILDNFPHIRAFWMMLGEKLAQVSLHFGVDDFDGTVMHEMIVHSAGASSRQSIPKERLIQLIKETGNIPVERDTLYNTLKVYR